MVGALRKSGIEILGDVPWGTHFCQFYHTKEDLIDILVPYFKEGLLNNEFCMWITSEPLVVEEAKEALRDVLPDINSYLEGGQLEILPYNEWYVIDGDFDSNRILNGWVEKLQKARNKGYDGLRLTGNTFWLEKEGWDDFVDYEEEINEVIGNYHMVALCTYSIDKCSANEIMDVIINHQFAIIRREGKWDLIESSEHKKQKKTLLWNQKRDELLADIFRKLLTNEDPQTIIDDICLQTMKFLDCDTFFNYLVDEEKGCLHLNACAGIPEEEAQKIEWLDFGVAVCGSAALESRRIVAENISESIDPKTQLIKSYGVQAYACHPLLIEGQSIGTLSFGTTTRLEFTPEELTLMKVVADQISIAMNRLISNRKLKASEEKYRELVQDANSIIIRWTIDGQITFFNEYAEKFFGYTEEELLNKSVMKIVPETEGTGKNLANIVQDIVDDPDQYVINENENMLKNGERVWIRWANRPIYNDEGKIQEILAVGMDITQRKKAEEALLESKAHFQVLIQNLQSAVALIDNNGRFVVVNSVFMKMFGLDNTFDILDVNDQDWGRWKVYGEDNVLLHFDEHPMRKVTLTGIPVKNQLVSVRNPGTDKLIWMLISADPIYDKNGNVNMIVSTYFDITERRKIEEHKQKLLNKEQLLTEELQTTNEELRSTTLELQRANEELMESQENLTEAIKKLKISNRDLEQFAYVASHDLQEPLRMVGSFAQLLEKRYKARLDEDADDYIAFIVDGAHRMKRLIDDLLAFSRLNTGAGEFEKINLEVVLSDVLLNLQTSVKKKKAQVTIGPLPAISGDPTQIQQLFQNLIINGIKFQDDGSPLIEVSAQESGDEWIFAVSDNGIGIRSDHQKQIFNVFSRLNAYEYEGSGIGLSIAKRIVERHGGQIWVESEPGEGSTFYFTLPKLENYS
ncbi:MAG: MEDS domain-containing protein [Methanobacteriaceae archaeon]